MFDYHGKSALVTGAGNGIGKRLVEELSRQGASVTVGAVWKPFCSRVPATRQRLDLLLQVSDVDPSAAEEVVSFSCPGSGALSAR